MRLKDKAKGWVSFASKRIILPYCGAKKAVLLGEWILKHDKLDIEKQTAVHGTIDNCGDRRIGVCGMFEEHE